MTTNPVPWRIRIDTKCTWPYYLLVTNSKCRNMPDSPPGQSGAPVEITGDQPLVSKWASAKPSTAVSPATNTAPPVEPPAADKPRPLNLPREPRAQHPQMKLESKWANVKPSAPRGAGVKPEKNVESHQGATVDQPDHREHKGSRSSRRHRSGQRRGSFNSRDAKDHGRDSKDHANGPRDQPSHTRDANPSKDRSREMSYHNRDSRDHREPRDLRDPRNRDYRDPKDHSKDNRDHRDHGKDHARGHHGREHRRNSGNSDRPSRGAVGDIGQGLRSFMTSQRSDGRDGKSGPGSKASRDPAPHSTSSTGPISPPPLTKITAWEDLYDPSESWADAEADYYP